MFLDDELNQIYENEGFCVETSKKLLRTALDRLPDPLKCGEKGFLNSIRQIDASWRLFCKKHKEYDPYGIKNFFINHIKISERIKRELRW